MYEMQLPNNIPIREHLSSESMSLIGIPRHFHKVNLEDFKTPDDGLLKVKNFVSSYLSQIQTKKRHEYLKGIFFCGSNGVGKTMLSSIILKTCYKYRYTCRRTTFTKYVSSYTSDWKAGYEADDYWEQCKACEVLCLEEVGKEIDSKITKPILEDLLRFREEKGLTTIMCTNLTPKDLEDIYGASIMSLIKGNMTLVQISGKDKRY